MCHANSHSILLGLHITHPGRMSPVGPDNAKWCHTEDEMRAHWLLCLCSVSAAGCDVKHTQVTQAWKCHKMQWLSCGGGRPLYCCFITFISLFLLKKNGGSGLFSWANNLKHWQQQSQTAQSFTLEWNLGCLGAALSELYQSKQGTFIFQGPLEIFCLVYNRVQLPVATPGKRKPKWFSSATFFSRQSILIKPTYIWPHNLKRYFQSFGVRETSCDK